MNTMNFNFNDIIKQSVLNNFSADMSPVSILISLVISLILGIYIFLVYRQTVNNEFYSKDFNKTLTLMGVVTSAIVLAIQSNLVISLGMVGALSIIRFRTAIKNPIDLFFMYWSIGTGIICGAGLYLLACVVCITVTLAVFIIERIESPTSLGLLVLHCSSIENSEKAIAVVKEYSEFCRIKNKTIRKDNVEVILEIKSKKESELEKALAADNDISRFAFMNFDREARI